MIGDMLSVAFVRGWIQHTILQNLKRNISKIIENQVLEGTFGALGHSCRLLDPLWEASWLREPFLGVSWRL